MDWKVFCSSQESWTVHRLPSNLPHCYRSTSLSSIYLAQVFRETQHISFYSFCKRNRGHVDIFLFYLRKAHENDNLFYICKKYSMCKNATYIMNFHHGLKWNIVFQVQRILGMCFFCQKINNDNFCFMSDMDALAKTAVTNLDFIEIFYFRQLACSVNADTCESVIRKTISDVLQWHW